MGSAASGNFACCKSKTTKNEASLQMGTGKDLD
jgi:hypothetical protein